MNCEFCEELNCPSISRFFQVYGSTLENRILAESGLLAAIPTMGQLFSGSLLILPKAHFETMSSLPAKELFKLDDFLLSLKQIVGKNCSTIVFEHGARCTTGGGCGIFHAHIHMVPVPRDITVDELLPSKENPKAFVSATSIEDALRRLKLSSEYLLVRDSTSQIRYVDISNLSNRKYPSQYFRRVLSELFNLNRPWDWRLYQDPEKDLLSTVEMFRSSDVSFSK